MKKLISILAAGITFLTAALSYAETSQPLSKILTSFDFSVVGLGLNASPDYQYVPKGIASEVDTIFDAGTFDAADIIAQLPADYTVRAELSGPGFQTPLALVTKPGKPFSLPTLVILGKYTLSNIRLVDGQGETLFGAVPQAVAIESISDPLLSSVTSRSVSKQELLERGVTFDSSNYTAYQFSAGFATQSGQVKFDLDVQIPNSEVIKNEEPSEQAGEEPVFDAPPLEIPPAPNTPQVQLPQNLSVSSFFMQFDEKEAMVDYKIPPIPGVVVIPGNIGFLHQYFSVLALVSNGAPLESKLNITNVQAKIVLPLGENLTPDAGSITDDDPLRLAKKDGVSFPAA